MSGIMANDTPNPAWLQHPAARWLVGLRPEASLEFRGTLRGGDG